VVDLLSIPLLTEQKEDDTLPTIARFISAKLADGTYAKLKTMQDQHTCHLGKPD
jgi:hypothetical protein